LLDLKPSGCIVMSEKRKVIFKNSKSAEFAMGFRVKTTSDIGIIEFIYFDDKKDEKEESIRENYIISSIAFTKDTAKDLIEQLNHFISDE